jgi:hypothetical protein
MEVALREIYSKYNGDISSFSDINVATELQYSIASSWPEVYYLRKLAEEGYVYCFQDQGQEPVYAVKTVYSPILNTILIEDETLSG